MTTNPLLNYPGSGSPSNPKGSYRASVPLSLYRELVKDLQDTQARIETLQSENQQILEENKRLRKQLKQVIDKLEPTEEKISISWEKERTNLPLSIMQSDYGSKNYPLFFSNLKSYKINVPPHSQREVSQLDSDGTINGWVLAIAILLIVATSCTSTFLIVNSKLKSNNR